MKKVFSITLALLLVTTMLHLSVATHYCHGKVEASKFSLTGKLATCGMENEEKDLPVSGTNISSHCCDDIVISVGINSDYAPSSSFNPEFFKDKIQVFFISYSLPVFSTNVLKSLYANESPPGSLMSTNVDLSEICVFRI